MEGIKKCCNCWCCCEKAYGVACCIDVWHAYEACGLAYLFCDACCWTLCAPLCIECKLGQSGKAIQNCSKGLKYCIFACVLQCVGCCDGCYNCIQIIKQVCGQGRLVSTYGDLTKNTQFLANKVKQALGLQCGNQPLKSMGTFTP